MLLKAHVRERLSRVIELANTRADVEIERGEDAMGSAETSFAAIGFGVGARFVRDMILIEFSELFDDDEEEDDDGIDS